MDRPVSRTTEIDVGTPPYAPTGWDTFLFNFHGFAGLSTETGRAVQTSRVSCFGHQWWLKLYPGGKRAKDGMITIYLHKSSNNRKGIRVKYELNIKDADGRKITNYASDETKFDDADSGWGWNDFIKHSYIVNPANNVLVDGALVVQLQIKSLQRSEGAGLPPRPFVPVNSCRTKMRALWDQDEKDMDVSFLIPGGDDDDDGESPKYKHHAHRAVLKACAPGLYELCEPYSDKKMASIPLTNVDPDVFHLLLSYVYGVDISVSDWKEHGGRLIEAADRYLLSDLKLEAEAWFVKSTPVTAENAIDLLLYADARNCALLKESVMDYFVENGRDALRLLSFEDIPDSRSLFTDLLLAVSARSNEERGGEDDGDESKNYKVMRISRLRRELDRLGLDTDGSREALIKRLEAREGDREGEAAGEEEGVNDGTANAHDGGGRDIGSDEESDITFPDF